MESVEMVMDDDGKWWGMRREMSENRQKETHLSSDDVVSDGIATIFR